ncbi:MAG: META domain-containing protein [Rhizobiaceae bacterium]
MKSHIAAVVPVALAVFLSACVSIEAADMDGTWHLVSVDGKAVAPADNVPQFTIDGNMIAGFDGCNQFGGKLDDPASIVVGQRECAGPLVKLPIDLSNPAEQLSAAELEGGRLHIPMKGGYPSSTYERK